MKWGYTHLEGIMNQLNPNVFAESSFVLQSLNGFPNISVPTTLSNKATAQITLQSSCDFVRVLAIAILLLVFCAGCLAQSPEPCSENSITWKANAVDTDKLCAGPLQYTLTCYNTKTDQEYGVDHVVDSTCTKPATCQNAQYLGVDPNTLETIHDRPTIYGTPETVNCSGTLDRTGETCGQNGPGRACNYRCTIYNYSTSCNVEEQKKAQSTRPTSFYESQFPLSCKT
jgi:hypothetical protein